MFPLFNNRMAGVCLRSCTVIFETSHFSKYLQNVLRRFLGVTGVPTEVATIRSLSWYTPPPLTSPQHHTSPLLDLFYYLFVHRNQPCSRRRFCSCSDLFAIMGHRLYNRNCCCFEDCGKWPMAICAEGYCVLQSDNRGAGSW